MASAKVPQGPQSPQSPPSSPTSQGPLSGGGEDIGLRHDLAAALLPELDELTRRVVDDIHAHSGTYAAQNLVSREDLWRICRDNLLSALEDFGGLPPTGGDFEHAARETGRRRAEQNLPLDTVLQAYRRGGRVMWQVMAEYLRAGTGRREPGPGHREPGTADRRDVELDVAGAVWETIDRYSLVMAESYRLTQLEMQGRQDTRRVALFEALLDGRGSDPAVASAAAAALGVPLHDRYVIVVAAQDPAAPPNPAPVLDEHGLWSFWRPRSGRYAGIVRLAAGESGMLLELLRGRTGATAGVSPEFDRLDGAGRALRLAEQTLRTLPAKSGEAAAFDDRLTEVLLTGRHEIAARIVSRYLGPVLDTAAERDALLDTLRIWLDHGCSAARAAELLYCHRNTVLNRIGRVAELTGRSAESGEDRLGWALALRALPLSGTGDEPAPDDDYWDAAPT
ncbi:MULTISPECIES: CdaR family transcriptional regulator [unclassified Streptomyces]|uniref:PucR family transcriptional regulator n=1 Tax=unclassified Streptomyces TaxID=2593676 RepID=UPI0009A1123A|nr:PucR family transcriptional regulator [Streptomyces sp. TSRI0281]